MMLCNTGWTDEAREASLAVRRAKAAARQADRQRMFDAQRRSAGRDFVENWYPRGGDGQRRDPYYGETSARAPYGYVDGTEAPRQEPLYDQYGRPIIPRPKEERRARWSLFGSDGSANLERDLEWLEKVHAAEDLWGRFGKKKRWMDQRPGATAADWEQHDREQFDEWKKQKREEESVDSGASGEGQSNGGGMENRCASGGASRSATAGSGPSTRLGAGCLILNRETFSMPEDGWYQIAPLGDFPHGASGVVQVVDREACEGMANRFTEDAKATNFAGLLIDFDHFSLDGEKRSEAAGWVVALEARTGGQRSEVGGQTANSRKEAQRTQEGAGLWAKIRWSDVGEEAVKGGRYRFLSPVWARKDCVDLGNGRVRPVRLLNAAVTNDPNLKGMVPLSNRGTEDGGQKTEDGRGEFTTKAQRHGEERALENSGGGASVDPDQLLRWELGTSPGDRHCPSCLALDGQVHRRADWDAAGLSPAFSGLYCQGNCHCSLVMTTEAESGDLTIVPQRAPVVNRSQGSGDRSQGEQGNAPQGNEDFLANTWSDAARAASLAVRRAKAAARRAAREAGGGDGRGAGDADDVAHDLERTREALEGYRQDAEDAFKREYGYGPRSPGEIAEAEELAGVPEKYRTRGDMTPEELARRLVEGEAGDPYEDDFLGWFEDEGIGSMTPEAIDRFVEDIREKLGRGESLEPAEEGFLTELKAGGEGGTDWIGGSPHFDESTGRYVYPDDESAGDGYRVLPYPEDESDPRRSVEDEKRRLRAARGSGG